MTDTILKETATELLADSAPAPELNETAAELLAASAPAPDTTPRVTPAEIMDAIRTLEGVCAELVLLESMQKKNAEDIIALSDGCNLDDTKALTQIGRMQVLSGLYPHRIEARQNKIPQAADHLVNLVGHFIHKTLSPKIHDVRARIVLEVKKPLAAHISDEFLLTRAIFESDAVLAVNSIYCTLQIGIAPEKVVEYAQKVLKSWEQIQAYEKAPVKDIKLAGQETYTEFFVKTQKIRKKNVAQISSHFTDESAV